MTDNDQLMTQTLGRDARLFVADDGSAIAYLRPVPKEDGDVVVTGDVTDHAAVWQPLEVIDVYGDSSRHAIVCHDPFAPGPRGLLERQGRRLKWNAHDVYGERPHRKGRGILVRPFPPSERIVYIAEHRANYRVVVTVDPHRDPVKTAAVYTETGGVVRKLDVSYVAPGLAVIQTAAGMLYPQVPALGGVELTPLRPEDVRWQVLTIGKGSK